MIMKTDDMLDNFDSNVSISEKKKVQQKSMSPKTSNRKRIQRTDNNEVTAESNEEHPLQFAPDDLHMLLKSNKHNAKSGQNKKLSKEEAHKQYEVD